MAKLTKTETAKRIGVSRATLYSYIRKGRISVDPEGTIDTAEILRAGFTLNDLNSSSDRLTKRDYTPPPELLETIHILQSEVSALRKDLDSERGEKSRLFNLLEESQRHHQRLLEAGERKGFLFRLKSWRREK